MTVYIQTIGAIEPEIIRYERVESLQIWIEILCDEVGTMTVMYDQCSGLTEVPEF